jgi:hypothetical protein
MATTSNYGWTTPDDSSLVKDGASAIRALGTAIDTSMNTALGTKKSGLVLLNTTSFSAVASQSISSVFSSTYDNYKIELVVTNSTSATCTMRLRTTSDDTTANYGYQHLRADATTLAGTRTLGATLFNLTPLAITSYFTASIELLSPNLSAYTQMRQLALNYGDMTDGAYFHTSTTAFTGFSLIASTGTITGKVSVYGYNL